MNVTLTARPTGTCSSLISFCAVDVLELPHPPLGGGVNLDRLVGRALQVEEHVCGPGEDHDGDEKRNDRPGQLERNRPVNALRRRRVDRWCGISPRTRSPATETSTAKNAVTATMKKYRLSTRAAIVDACSGNSENPDPISAQACLSAAVSRSRAPHQQNEPHDETRRSAAPPSRTMFMNDGAVTSGASGRTGSSRAAARRRPMPTVPSPESTSARRSSFGEYSTP